MKSNTNIIIIDDAVQETDLRIFGRTKLYQRFSHVDYRLATSEKG